MDKKFLVLISFLFVFIGVPPVAAAAGSASIFVGPASGTFTVGGTFTVSVYLNTGGNAINAVEANLAFPADKLQVVAPSAGKSVVQVWVNQPTYSNEQGTLRFQGAIPSPGINTESGLISTVTFRVKNVGQAIVKVLDSSRILLNDGKGTDILGQTASGIYSLILPPPAGPIVASPTHPDQEKWYLGKTAALRWEAAPGTQGFSYVLSDEPVDFPDDISEGLKTAITYNNLADGTYYFHVKTLREATWGGVSHYAVNIDNTPPAEFEINFSPGDRTSNHFPLMSFDTTDAVSGVDHYEIKIITLSKSEQKETSKSNLETPFFIEATSPYTRELILGKYDVVIRAYDRAGNFYQATRKLTVIRAIFEMIKGEGLNFRGNFIIRWPFIWGGAVILILILVFLGRKVWRWHRHIERQLETGAARHPSILEKTKVLKNKLAEYGKKLGHGGTLLLLFLLGSLVWGASPNSIKAQEIKNLAVEPPVVTLFPKSISNDEILYIGGRAGAPGAEVVIYIQSEESGTAISQSVKTDKDGEWFYSLPDFLDPGKYAIWTQFKVGEQLSPPSSKLDLEVAKTAVQFGGKRISYESLYLVLFLVILAALLAVLSFVLYHAYHHRAKKTRLMKEIREAEESVRRGFLVLRRDIEAELALVRKVKMSKELEVEEKLSEEKLLKDLEWVNGYIGKEVWEVEREL